MLRTIYDQGRYVSWMFRTKHLTTKYDQGQTFEHKISPNLYCLTGVAAGEVDNCDMMIIMLIMPVISIDVISDHGADNDIIE